jgi:hypothetical protein
MRKLSPMRSSRIRRDGDEDLPPGVTSVPVVGVDGCAVSFTDKDPKEWTVAVEVEL